MSADRNGRLRRCGCEQLSDGQCGEHDEEGEGERVLGEP